MPSSGHTTCRPRRSISASLLVLPLAVLLSACGGSDDDGGDNPAPSNPAAPGGGRSGADAFANQCAPNNEYAKTRGSGSLAAERDWVRAYMQEQYLWYARMGNPDPAASAYNGASGYTSLRNWFAALKTSEPSPSGKAPLDQFSFVYPTDLWNQLMQAGVSVGYGFELTVVSSRVPRDYRVAYVDKGSPAELAGFARGDSIRAIVRDDGSVVSIDATEAGEIAFLNAALSPSAEGQSVIFRVQSRDGNLKDLKVSSASISSSPLYRAGTFDRAGAGPVGYVVFNSFSQPGEGQLLSTLTEMRDRGVSELVLDLRYNSGGYLYMASQLAYMIAGAERTRGKAFETLEYNDRITPTIPLSDRSTPFFGQSSGMEGTNTRRNTPLPTLNLKRLFVLTTGSTCSASESIVNGLRGIDLPVVVIGDTTCGKPYGFQARDNCGISYFPIQFKGVNAKGFGDYAEGFAPDVLRPDDLAHELGDPAEQMLNTALGCVQSPSGCAAGTVGAATGKAAGQVFPRMEVPPWRSAKVLR